MLSCAAARAPAAALHSSRPGALALLTRVVQESADAAPVTLRAALPCVGTLLGAAAGQMDAAACTLHAAAFTRLLLAHATDARPKVRRAAAAAAEECLGGLVGSRAGAACCDAVARWAHSALAAPQLQSRDEEQARAASTAALHTLGCLQVLLPRFSGAAAAARVAEDALALLAALPDGLVAQHALDALAALLAAEAAPLPPAAAAQLLRALADLPFDALSPASAVALCAALRVGHGALHGADASLGALALPSGVHALARLLRAAPAGGVAAAAADALQHMLRECVDARMVAEAVRALSARRSSAAAAPPTPLQSVCVALEAMLGYRYREAWPAVLPVLAVAFERLGVAAAALLPGALSALAQMVAAPQLSCRAQLRAALSAVIHCAGAERVCAALPLDLQAACDAQVAAAQRRGGGSGKRAAEDAAEDMEADGGEGGDKGDDDADAPGNAWLLPLLAQHATGARLSFFTVALLPAAKAMAARAEAARSGGRAFEAACAAALERAVWNTLPAFATYPEDVASAFPSLAKELGAHLASRTDLAPPIMTALTRLLTLMPEVARGGGEGYERPDDAPAWLTADTAAAGVASVVSFTRNFLPILFNAFVAAPTAQRGAIAETVRAFASASEPEAVGSFFRVVLKKLITVTAQPEGAPGALLEGGATRGARRATFLELLLPLAPGLAPDELSLLLRAALPVLAERDAALQKRVYRLAAWLAEQRGEWLAEGEGKGKRLQELLAATLAAQPACLPAARHHRLRLLGALLPALRLGEPEQAEGAAPLLGELLLGTKESNAKARAAAYELLVQLARRLEARVEGEGAPGEGARRLFGTVLAGLAGSAPTMVAASLMAASRLVYEFSAPLVESVPALLPAALALLRAKNREVVKAALGFVKVAAVRLPAPLLTPHLPGMMAGLLVWAHDSKNRFRAKVRAVVERLVRRCGYEAVAAHAPGEHAALVVHIRREQGREEKRKRAGSHAGDHGPGGAPSVAHTRGGRSAWDASELFSQGGVGTRAGEETARTGATSRSAQRAQARAPLNVRLSASRGSRGAAAEPLDLMDEHAMRRMLRAEPGGARGVFDDSDDDGAPSAAYARAPDGRMVVTEELGFFAARKRAREGEEDEDGARSQGGRSRRSQGAGSAGPTQLKKRVRTGATLHTAAAFRPAKKGTGGDVSRTGQQPYAYWPMDAKLLNRRAGRRRQAAKGLDKVVRAVKHAGARAPRK